MLENEKKQQELLNTTDSLEAIGAFKAMKNLLFVVVIICLALLQVSFWLVDRAVVQPDTGPQVPHSTPAISPAAAIPVAEDVRLSSVEAKDEITTTVEEAARQLKSETGPPMGAAQGKKQKSRTKTATPQGVLVRDKTQGETENKPAFYKRFGVWAWLIRFCNFVLMVTAVLYSLTILFSLKISLIGRLGGINHISRAFFLSLFALVFLLPWQRLFGDIPAETLWREFLIAGAIYTPQALARVSHPSADQTEAMWALLYYVRFVGWPVIVLIFLTFAQIRTVRWARATLRRLEVV